jgi:hypothetical protein
MDVENRRIVLSIAERLKDYDEEAAEEFIKEHPRLEDVVAAEAAAEAEGSGEDAPVSVADYPEEAVEAPAEKPAAEEPVAEEAPAEAAPGNPEEDAPVEAAAEADEEKEKKED